MDTSSTVILPTGQFAYWIGLLDCTPTRHFAYYLDSSPTDCSSFYRQDYWRNHNGGSPGRIPDPTVILALLFMMMTITTGVRQDWSSLLRAA